MRIGIILHPYGEKKPGGLPRIIYGWAEALMSVDKENEYIIYLKEKPDVLPDFGGRAKVVVLGGGKFWLNRLKSAPASDVYLFNTPVLPLFWKPKHTLLITLDYPYKYLKADNFKQKISRIFIFLYHRYSLKRVDHIVAVSGSTANDTTRFFGISKDKISVVYHGFKDLNNVPEIAFDLPQKFFFFAGTMKERKNVLNIIKGFQIFLKNNSEATHSLILAGKNEGKYYEGLKDYISESKLEEKVIFSGHLNEGQLSFAYKRAEALVFPSIVEGTGFPILEAMGVGTPVITSNIFGPAELGANGGAYLVNPYKSEEIAEGMAKISNDKLFKQKLIENGFKQSSRFSWTNTGRETLDILEQISGKNKKTAITFFAHNAKDFNGGGVLTRKIAMTIQKELPAKIKIVTATPSSYDDEEILFDYRWFFSFKKLLRLKQIVRQSDVVHAFDIFPYGFVAVFFAIFTKTKVIVTLNGTGTLRYIHKPHYFHLVKFAFKKANKLVAISNFVKDEILKKIPDLKIDVINPGIDFDVFSKKPATESLAKLAKYEPYILSVGALRLRKGYKFSIPAFKKVSEKFPDLKYVIIGKKYTNKEYNRLKKLVEDLDLKDKVFFVENVDSDEELASFYHKAKLFCLMSFNVTNDVEGFGIVFLGAACAGIPVVGMTNSGIIDATKNGANGILVEGNTNMSGFANAIIEILSDEKKYHKFSEASFKLAPEFDWKIKNAEYIKIYKEMV